MGGGLYADAAFEDGHARCARIGCEARFVP